MADNRFPLFRIPFLALCIILHFYSVHDIIQLSLCSKHSLRVAKKCWKKKGSVKATLTADIVPNIHVFFRSEGFYYRFYVSGVHDIHDEQTHNITVGNAVVPSIHKGTETVTYWDDKISGIEYIVSYIKYLFDEPIHSICLTTKGSQNEFIRNIDSVMSLQGFVRECTLNGLNTIDDSLAHVLDNCNVTESLTIYGRVSCQFRHSWNISVDDVGIPNGSSITFQNLMNIDCQSFTLYCSRLTSKDANQFLKHWQNGGNSRLKFLSIELTSLDQETVTSGIDTVLQPKILRRCYQRMKNSKTEKWGGFDIWRNDGTLGTIFLYYNVFELGVDPKMIPQAD